MPYSVMAYQWPGGKPGRYMVNSKGDAQNFNHHNFPSKVREAFQEVCATIAENDYPVRPCDKNKNPLKLAGEVAVKVAEIGPDGTITYSGKAGKAPKRSKGAKGAASEAVETDDDDLTLIAALKAKGKTRAQIAAILAALD